MNRVSKWRWMPFVALSTGALFLCLLIVFIVPSQIDGSKSSPTPRVASGTGLTADNDEPRPFAVAATTGAPRDVRPGMRHPLEGLPFAVPPDMFVGLELPEAPMSAPPEAPASQLSLEPPPLPEADAGLSLGEAAPPVNPMRGMRMLSAPVQGAGEEAD